MVRRGRRDASAVVTTPRIARLVLRVFGAADRRDEIEADLGDLFQLAVCGVVALFVTSAGIYALLGFTSSSVRVRSVCASPWGSSGKTDQVDRAAEPDVGRAGNRHRPLRGGGDRTIVQPLLVETSARDAFVFVATAVTLLAIATAASTGPARRAARVDPNVASQTE